MHPFEARLYYAILISSIVLGSVILYFAVTVFRNQRRHYQQQRQHFLAEIQLLESERKRISQDLHDELGPLLALTKIQLSNIRREEVQDESYLLADKNLEVIMQRMGGIALNLIPPRLEERGLRKTLESFVQQYEETTGLRVQFLYHIQQVLPPEMKLHLFRMVQEMMHNTIKHSKSSDILVHLKERKKKIYLLYKSSGSVQKQNSFHLYSHGIGMSSLQNRTMLLGGKLNFDEKQPGEYFIEIPLIYKPF